jgi:hypothetical protein
MTTTSAPHPPSTDRKVLVSNGMWMVTVYGLLCVALFVFFIYSSVAKGEEAKRAYVSLAAPIEAALNDTYTEDITYTRAYGREHPSSRFYTYTDTLTVDGIERTDCALSYREVSAGRVADVSLSCLIKPVHEDR